MSNNSLSRKEHFDLVVEQGLKSIPGMGFVAEHYYMVQDEKRFKRLEEYFEMLQNRMENREFLIKEDSEEWMDQLTHLIEKVLDNVEKESIKDKRKLFANYTANLFSSNLSEKEIVYESELILEILIRLTYIDLIILNSFFIQNEENVLIKDISVNGLDQYGVLGTVNNLKNAGLLKSTPHSISLGGYIDNNLNEMVSISSFGYKFIDNCFREEK